MSDLQIPEPTPDDFQRDAASDLAVCEAATPGDWHFACFARNGRWGTCACCPRDRQGNAWPEFCKNTDRYDHKLPASSLSAQFDARRATNA